MVSSRPLIPILALLFVLFTFSEAKEILVGGHEDSWKIPPSADALNKWAASIRFKVGDFLIWKYDGKSDSVLEVTKEDYESCKTSKPVKEFKEGNTKFELDHPGPFYFISGAEGHCQKGQKVEVVVMSDKHDPGHSGSSPPVASPAPAPAPTKSSAAGLHGLLISSSLGLVLGAIVLGLGLVLV
ncbi:hypothetical protein ACOSP7_012523 [Xanthoceras sorbifolium]